MVSILVRYGSCTDKLLLAHHVTVGILPQGLLGPWLQHEQDHRQLRIADIGTPGRNHHLEVFPPVLCGFLVLAVLAALPKHQGAQSALQCRLLLPIEARTVERRARRVWLPFLDAAAAFPAR